MDFWDVEPYAMAAVLLLVVMIALGILVLIVAKIVSLFVGCV